MSYQSYESIESSLEYMQCRSSSNIMSIIDMVWSGLEVFLILIVLLPSEEISWKIAVIFILPNIIQLSAAIILFRNTKEDQDTLTVFRYCKVWLFLAFVTILLYAAFATWVTIVGIVSVFLAFVIILKIFWRFTAMYFVNELYNELALQVPYRNYARQENLEDE